MRVAKYITIGCLTIYVGFLAWVLHAYGLMASTVLTVQATPSPSSGVFPQFALGGQILTTYTPGKSIYVNSWDQGTYTNGSEGNSTPMSNADAIGGGVTVFNHSLFSSPAVIGCNATNFALSGGTGNCGNWHNYYATNLAGADQAEFNATGIASLGVSDNLETNRFDFFNVDGTQNWAYPALNDEVQQFVANPAIIMHRSFDELFLNANNLPFAQNGYDGDFAAELAMMEVVLGHNPAQPHVAWGAETKNQGFDDWYTNNNPTWSDFVWAENLGLSGTTDNDRMMMESQDHYRTVLTPQLPNPNEPFFPETGAGGYSYCKAHVGQPWAYDPALGDVNLGPGNAPGPAIDDVIYPAAHGFPGSWSYAFDSSAPSRSNNSACTNAQCLAGAPNCTEEEGTSPIGAWTAFHGMGQDRWYAWSIVANLTKTYQAYILQPMAATQPANCVTGAQVTCSGVNCSSPGDPIICGAHQGNGGFFVIIENFSDSPNTYSYNQAPYYQTGAGATNVTWKLQGSNNRGCNNMTSTGTAASPNNTNGISSYSANGGLTGNYDCGIGDSWINGLDSWQPGQAFPTGAPVANGTLTLNMTANEVDVFLYHL